MAIAFVQQATHVSVDGVSEVTTAAITTTVGNLVVLMGGFYRSGGTTITVTDSKSNTWNTDVNVVAGATNELEGRVLIASCILVNAGSSHTFTFDDPQNGVYIEMDAVEFSGIIASPLDKTADDHGGSGDTACSPTTAALAQNDELAVAALFSGVNDSSISISHPPSGFTSVGATNYPGGSYRCGYSSGYKIVTDGAAQNAAWTFGGGGAISENAGVIATYKGVAVAGPPPIIESRMRIPAQMLEGEDVFQAEALSLKAWF